MTKERRQKESEKDRTELVESLETAADERFVGAEPLYEEERELIVGSAIEDRYEILALIGEGGVGTVYRARHLLLDKIVAIKFLLPALAKEKRAIERFKLEAEANCHLTHSSIVAVREYGISQGRPFLVMDYIEGTSLREMLEAGSKLSEKQIIEALLPVLEGLGYAHKQGIIHRDIKPANIMICEDGGAKTSKILDFGIAKIVELDANENRGLTRTGEIFGTPAYMSPEQCYGKRIGVTADIYSIGCVLYELVTGRAPFDGESALEIFMRHVNDPVPAMAKGAASKNFETVISRCLEKDEVLRYQTVEELKNDLVAVVDGQPITIRKKPLKADRKRKLIVAAACLVLLVAGIAGAFFQQPKWRQSLIRAQAAQELKDFSERRRLTNLALESAQKEGISDEDLMRLYEKVSIANRDVSDFRRELEADAQYIALARKLGKIKEEEDMRIMLAQVELKHGDRKKAIDNLKALEASLIKTRSPSFAGLCTVYWLLGRASFEDGDLEKAADFLKKSIRQVNDSHFDDYQGILGSDYYTLALIYQKSGDLESAYKFIRLAKNIEGAVVELREKDHFDRNFLSMPISEKLAEIKSGIDGK
ncbi:MAG: serine/threonine protein kinase [Cyanobacteria bacterium HKST-UBA02]|nr:serine/threonine protein kinase [Cyanobacteria bacterium HKST-UBA02]